MTNPTKTGVWASAWHDDSLATLSFAFLTSIRAVVVAWLTILCLAPCWSQQEDYPTHPDSVAREDVPTGQIEGPFEHVSKIFPGTTRNYWLYIPEQYDASKPACLFVLQDGLSRANGWNLPTVMDNLIANGDMPVTIGVFVDHGRTVPTNDERQPRFNRSFEYDSVGDRYANFLIDEFLPIALKDYNVSDDPNDRSIGGASSGAVCAFNVAWERPDQFRRVLSTIGTYVGLRGADAFPTLIRKCEPKPIRVFLQDGSQDLNIYGGDWWMANQAMLSALEFAGYEVQHIWGTGGHNAKHAAAIMPDALRWLWKNHGQAIRRGTFANHRIDLLIDGENWQEIEVGSGACLGICANDEGDLRTVSNAKVVAIPANDSGGFDETKKFDTDIELPESVANQYAAKEKSVEMHAPSNNYCLIRMADSWNIVALAQASDGTEKMAPDRGDLAGLTDYQTVAFSSDNWYGAALGSAPKYLSRTTKERQDTERNDPQKDAVQNKLQSIKQRIVVDPQQTQLYEIRSNQRFVIVRDIQSDNTLRHRQPFGYLHLPPNGGPSCASSIALDTEGNVYVATEIGIQVLDPLGRVNLILEKPTRGKLTDLCFAGKGFNQLVVICDGKIFTRRTKLSGHHPSSDARTIPRPGL